MRIQKLRLKNFRCFLDKVFDLDGKFVIIEGNNGSGKTSLLEALHYACYLRSFRTRSGKELVNFEKDHFFIQLDVEEELGVQNIQVGLSGGNKVVKLNQKPIATYKELVDTYRVVAATEDDLSLIKGSPETRRTFLNQALAIQEPDFVPRLREYKQVLSNRNSLLFRSQHTALSDDILVWSKQLWEKALNIQESRVRYLAELEKSVEKLMQKYFSEERFSVGFEYKSKIELADTFEVFWEKHKAGGLNEERRYGRSLFGTHLDDFSINFRSKKAKLYASRGQQKLVVFLIKIAEAELLQERGAGSCLLLDDFLTDLDENIFSKCLQVLLDLDKQVFITCPLKSFITSDRISDLKPTIIHL